MSITPSVPRILNLQEFMAKLDELEMVLAQKHLEVQCVCVQRLRVKLEIWSILWFTIAGGFEGYRGTGEKVLHMYMYSGCMTGWKMHLRV